MLPPPGIMARLDEEIMHILDPEWVPEKGTRNHHLFDIAYGAAQAGLTNNEICLILADRAIAWGIYGEKSPYTMWHRLVSMVGQARKEFPSQGDGRYSEEPYIPMRYRRNPDRIPWWKRREQKKNNDRPRP